MEHPRKIGHRNAVGVGPVAHGELVAEVARGRHAHARQAQVLAQIGRHLDVVVAHRHESVELHAAVEVAHRAAHRRHVLEVGKRVDAFERLARPGRLQQLGVGEQEHAAAEAVGLFHEVLALEVAGNAKDDGRLKRHDGAIPS
ncbi:hypothetical protein D3C72_1726680 [compost metagenome]